MKRYSVKIMILQEKPWLFRVLTIICQFNILCFPHYHPFQALKMFNKKKKPAEKKPSALTPPQKAGVLKRAERALFKVFNQKSRRRHKVLMALLLTPPALGVATFWHNDPSSERQQGGAEQVQQYTREISEIARDTRAFAITPEGAVVRGDAAQLVALDNRIQALAPRLALDTKISEQDALDLTRQFMRDINSPIVGPQLRAMLGDLVDNAAYLEEARRSLERSGATENHPGMRAADVLAKADQKDRWDFIYDFLLGFFFMNMVLGDNFRSLLARAGRRNEKLQHEEKKEQFVDHVAELRAMLTPKGATPPAPAKSDDTPAPRTRKK